MTKSDVLTVTPLIKMTCENKAQCMQQFSDSKTIKRDPLFQLAAGIFKAAFSKCFPVNKANLISSTSMPQAKSNILRSHNEAIG